MLLRLRSGRRGCRLLFLSGSFQDRLVAKTGQRAPGKRAFFMASGGNAGTEGFLSLLSGCPGLAILCAPWEAPALDPSLLEDEKLSQ